MRIQENIEIIFLYYTTRTPLLIHRVVVRILIGLKVPLLLCVTRAHSRFVVGAVTMSSIRDRAGHATFCKGEKLYIHAGYDSHHQVLTDMIEIDTATRTHTHLLTLAHSPFFFSPPSPQTANFTCKKLEYTKVVSNVERRWHSSHFFERENKFMIHGGWNQGGPLEDLLMLDLGKKNLPYIWSFNNNILFQYLKTKWLGVKWRRQGRGPLPGDITL